MTKKEFDSLKIGDPIIHLRYGKCIVWDLRKDDTHIYAEQDFKIGSINFLAHYRTFKLCPIKKFSNKLEGIINE